MKAAVFSNPGEPLTIQDVDKPEISEDEMLVLVKHRWFVDCVSLK